MRELASASTGPTGADGGAIAESGRPWRTLSHGGADGASIALGEALGMPAGISSGSPHDSPAPTGFDGSSTPTTRPT